MSGVGRLAITSGVHAPEDSWPGDTVYGWEWPVEWGYRITYEDGSVGYYPSWEVIPNQILQLQEEGYYEDATVTAISWDTGVVSMESNTKTDDMYHCPECGFEWGGYDRSPPYASCPKCREAMMRRGHYTGPESDHS